MAAGRLLAGFGAVLAARPGPMASGDTRTAMILSIVAIVVSVLCLGATAWIASRQILAGARLRAIEQGHRADEVGARAQQPRQAPLATVTVQWREGGPALLLHNRGHAPALDVAVEVTSATPGGLPPGLPSDDGRLAMARLDPGRSHAVPVTVPYGLAAVIQVTVRWRDGAGSHEDIVKVPTVGQ